MPLGQWYKLLVARKWFKLIFSKLAKPFNLVLWHKTRTCGNKKNLRLLKLGKGVQRSLKRFSLKEFCWLGFITPMWEGKKALIYLYTSSFPLSSLKWFLTTTIPLPTSGLEANFFQKPFSQSHKYSQLSPYLCYRHSRKYHGDWEVSACSYISTKTTLFSEFQNKVKY